MKRREFLQYGVRGLAVVATHPLWASPLFGCGTVATAQSAAFELRIGEALVEMIDKTAIYHRLFAADGGAPSFPGPVLLATAGERITITVINELDDDHAFEVPGVAGSATGPIPPGGTATVRFAVPAAGSYLYLDPLRAPVNRMLGLHGALVVLPRGVAAGGPVNTPYTRPTPAVQHLFDDLGTAAHFPGDAWLPPPADRSRIWLFHEVDPLLNQRIEAGQAVDPGQVRNNFLPRYFLINGRSGYFAAHEADTAPHGYIGEPQLIRILNAGLATHSPHIHGNHIFPTAINGVVQENLANADTWTVGPLERVDWLLPFVRPPDIAGNPALPLRDLLATELSLVLGDSPQSPLHYPMHDHTEQSQTAAGGNYPQGLITHFSILGDIDKVPFPASHRHAGAHAGGGSHGH